MSLWQDAEADATEAIDGVEEDDLEVPELVD
jgi:hypothetical protein